MINVILHTTNCPRCHVLEKKLIEKNIQFEENNDIELMLQKGFDTAPMLEVNGEIMDFKEATAWINKQ